MKLSSEALVRQTAKFLFKAGLSLDPSLNVGPDRAASTTTRQQMQGTPWPNLSPIARMAGLGCSSVKGALLPVKE
eukprot:9500974-Pyramimonas_sp.AAC.1